jgi:two-component system, NtrC family, nitrogen regulation sensor histidine kinase GlnL
VGRDLQTVLDALLDGVIVVDAQGRVERVNAEACRILETSDDAASGQPIERLVGKGHTIARAARGVLGSGRSLVESECRVERRFADDLVVEVAASPLVEDDRSTGGAVVALRDRTIHHALSELVNERERLSAFGHIAAGIAHEVKNPLGGIRGAAEILAARAAPGKTRDAAELIVREVDRIAALVDDLMIFTREGALSLAPVNIHRVLDDVLELLSMDPIAAGVELERRFDPSIPELQADSGRLVQVFLNLARNALQAMEGQGTLSIETRMTLAHRLGAESGESLPTLLVTVADNGPGIAPDVIDKVTTPLFTTRRGGTGLGLSVARHWVSHHGGTLRIDSEPGRGTRVRVALPLRRAAEAR